MCIKMNIQLFIYYNIVKFAIDLRRSQIFADPSSALDYCSFAFELNFHLYTSKCKKSLTMSRMRRKGSEPNKCRQIITQGVKLIFFSDSHLAPKFFKVVANSKKVGHHFQRQTKYFFTLSAF